MRPNKNVRVKIFESTDCRVYQHIIFRLLTLNMVLLVRTLVQNQDPLFHFLSSNTFLLGTNDVQTSWTRNLEFQNLDELLSIGHEVKVGRTHDGWYGNHYNRHLHTSSKLFNSYILFTFTEKLNGTKETPHQLTAACKKYRSHFPVVIFVVVVIYAVLLWHAQSNILIVFSFIVIVETTAVI